MPLFCLSVPSLPPFCFVWLETHLLQRVLGQYLAENWITSHKMKNAASQLQTCVGSGSVYSVFSLPCIQDTLWPSLSATVRIISWTASTRRSAWKPPAPAPACSHPLSTSLVVTLMWLARPRYRWWQMCSANCSWLESQILVKVMGWKPSRQVAGFRAVSLRGLSRDIQPQQADTFCSFSAKRR